MAAPLAFDFRTKLQNVFETAEIELRVFGEASGVGDADVVVFDGDFGSDVILSGEEIDDLLLVCGVKEPSLGFDASGEKRDEEFTVILGPGALGEEARG